MKYTVFEEETGRILRRYELHEKSDILLNTGPGEGFVKGEFSDATHYVAGGVAVEFPERPGPLWVWDYTAAAWADTEAERLDEIREEGARRINSAANAERKTLMTPLFGQETVLALKREEAAAFVADEAPDLSQYPLISAEVGLTGQTCFEVAQVFLNLNALAVETLAGIEARRMAALAAVEAAGNAAAVEAAVSIMTA